MILALSSKIKKIDEYSAQSLGIPVLELMQRAGNAVADAIRARTEAGGRVIFFAGKGNNGGDGYAAACNLLPDYDVRIYDVFDMGQRSPEGKHFLSLYKQMGGTVIPLLLDDETVEYIKSADCIVDAIFGTGISGEIPDNVCRLSGVISELVGVEKIAIDVPVGVNADDGSVNSKAACAMNATVALSFIKPGLLSYPGKAYVGELVYDDLGLPRDKIQDEFDFSHNYIDSELATQWIPEREDNSSKGSFGKALLICGSDRYRGAAHLAVSAALRGGVGLVSYLGEEDVIKTLLPIYPEAVYYKLTKTDKITATKIKYAEQLSASHSATLVGCGSGNTPGLARLVSALMLSEGGPLVVDADGINALAELGDKGRETIRCARRKVILTPHPLEFARLVNIPVADVQDNRLALAVDFAAKHGCILVLKGAATIITDGKTVYINGSGSSALAKAGSGDVLAGLITSVVASGTDPLTASAFAVYYHGAAADSLALEFSTLGVSPSDLPRKICEMIAAN